MSNLCKRARRMRAGVSLFKVYYLRGTTFIREAVVAARPKDISLSGLGSKFLFVDVKVPGAYIDGVYYENRYSQDCWSLGDMNVQDGGHNSHRVFFKRATAQRYMNLLIAMGAKHCDY